MVSLKKLVNITISFQSFEPNFPYEIFRLASLFVPPEAPTINIQVWYMIYFHWPIVYPLVLAAGWQCPCSTIYGEMKHLKIKKKTIRKRPLLRFEEREAAAAGKTRGNYFYRKLSAVNFARPPHHHPPTCWLVPHPSLSYLCIRSERKHWRDGLLLWSSSIRLYIVGDTSQHGWKGVHQYPGVLWVGYRTLTSSM